METPVWTPPDDVLTRAAPAPDHVLRYGPEPEHVADLRLPAGGGPAPLVIFLHGGFWRAAFDRAHTGPLASGLAAAGYPVCVPEFRRTGQPGGGWPGTFDDVATAVDRLPALVRAAAPDVVADGPILAAGHSAGGQLALWSAGRHRLPADSPWRLPAPAARGVVALSAVSRLADCYQQDLGNGAAAALIGGGPDRYPGRYQAADPAALLPLGCPVRLVHGTLDDRVPLTMSRAFLALARGAGDDCELAEPAGASHFDVIDPLSPAWPQVVAEFTGLAPPGAGTAS